MIKKLKYLKIRSKIIF